MDHIAGFIFLGILFAGLVRLAASMFSGWLMARFLRPRAGKTTAGHVLSALTGGALIPVIVERLYGPPMTLIDAAAKNLSGKLLFFAYVAAFSMICGAGAAWLYRNIRLAGSEEK